MIQDPHSFDIFTDIADRLTEVDSEMIQDTKHEIREITGTTNTDTLEALFGETPGKNKT